ncbi:class I SAM-dependent methyltransferase [Bradyrhizobium symbiodeficiens]|uniref:class I SAM-dependent methyltransferase n=1 Tax=Bradyrhizobium symbiodeficiens TaxID=1404367 RepID=UPI0030D1951A
MSLHEGNWPDARSRRRQGPVAPERSLRIKAFYGLLPYVSHLARQRRMRRFVQLMDIKPGTRVLDLGGSPRIWDNVEIPLDVTMLNLPGAIPSAELESIREPGTNIHSFHHIEGDACKVSQFADASFDLIFSNSVIEHVGPEDKQEEFAREVIRLGKSYWVQTPSPWFPIEAHSGLPFYWFYPERFRAWLLARSRKTLPAWWTDYIATTRILSHRRMAKLFPNARIRVEFLFGLPKSYVAHSGKNDTH